jgi:hypothetical protein
MLVCMELIEQARRLVTPLIEEGRAIFVWEGPISPLVLADFYDWAGAEMKPAGGRTWTLVVELPNDTYCKYTLMLGRQVNAPFNRRSVPNPFGTLNHHFYMPRAEAAAEVRCRFEVPMEKITRFHVDTGDSLGEGKGGVTLYAPPVEGPVSLTVVYDGREYFERARIKVVCDNLIAQGRMHPLALALVENHPQRRSLEYACSEGTLGFLAEKALPLAHNELPLVDLERMPGTFGVIGASFGGLMALYTGLRMLRIFGHVLAQSGAYTLQGHRFSAWDLKRLPDLEKPRVWMDAGSME